MGTEEVDWMMEKTKDNAIRIIMLLMLMTLYLYVVLAFDNPYVHIAWSILNFLQVKNK